MSLLLKDVQYTDQGSYHCTVATHSRKYDETVNLFIPEPEYPTVYFDSVTSTFTCNSSGWYREPKVQWTNEKGENLTDQSETAPAEKEGEVYKVMSVLKTSDLHQQYICTVQEGDRKSNTQLPHKWEDGALSLLSELPCHEVEKSECKPST
ncbi:butyrophilin-like protein 1 [Acipenser oxyrinchus oxyrinchus]|uniref:Butyrophilin-like protein 1 n=1 Tax=Acipenser oxyrinchus oxyrinchus TaxID=40147 RepID=A0AAD8CR88_ACIOX|nr:butyrophilin-like protein 1 [Acipenser oxyrinchus oxyrinchus]